MYGDCGGERVDESRPVAPQTARAQRRVDAERRLAAMVRRACASRSSCCARRASTPRTGCRSTALRERAPVLRAEDDVYTNHIHADDLARALRARAGG